MGNIVQIELLPSFFVRGSLSHHSLTDTGSRVCVSCNIVLVVNNYTAAIVVKRNTGITIGIGTLTVTQLKRDLSHVITRVKCNYT